MRAEFFRPDDPDRVLATATWDGGAVSISTDDADARRVLERVFRVSSVSLEDPVLGDPAATGGAVVEPGDLTWFRTAALVRGPGEGLRVRFLSETPGGWDPAGAYRPLEAWVAASEGDDSSPPSLGTSRA
jgi:hypothetical protein